MSAYYNEVDPFAAQWLRNLSAAGHIAPGEVDERSIVDVRAADLVGFSQHHFFAGIGVWSHALRLAGWPDERPVWTGSCPCQPFSGAGTRGGTGDARHLWPVWYDLIRECGPVIILGEQVASPDALGWWDIVQADLERAGYPCAAIDLCAAGDGAPHIRQRLWWVAYAAQQQRNGYGDGRSGGRPQHSDGCGPDRLAYTGRAGLSPRQCPELPGTQRHDQGRAVEQCRGASSGMGNAQDDDGRLSGGSGRLQNPQSVGTREAGGLGDAKRNGRGAWRDGHNGRDDRAQLDANGRHDWTGPLHGFWAEADWLLCTDGKWRPVEPGTQPLAHGVACRVGKLRAYGNAICAPLATSFIEAVMECAP